ncbi:hypothetical protein [Kurthia sibirica]|nr:hypothetical protein [Kurthia sibirica]GEK34406.1 hypothetical protein KSI01_19390 [Kurthia sibirica]
MSIRISYPYEVKMKAVQMKFAGVPTKQILTALNSQNSTQVETWTC